MILASALIFTSSCASDAELLQKQLTIIESVTKCNAVEEDHFFACDSDGEWYKVIWDDTEGLSEGDVLTVYYEEITKISYETGYPDGYTPTLQMVAKKVKK